MEILQDGGCRVSEIEPHALLLKHVKESFVSYFSEEYGIVGDFFRLLHLPQNQHGTHLNHFYKIWTSGKPPSRVRSLGGIQFLSGRPFIVQGMASPKELIRPAAAMEIFASGIVEVAVRT